MKLPNKPSALINLALKDLCAVEKMRGYKISMNEAWHRPNGKCTVCFAGSVMAKTLKIAKDDHASPEDFGKENEGKLQALDDFRCGEIIAALGYMNIIREEVFAPSSVFITPYNENKKKFKEDMKSLAKNLATVGY